MFMTMKHARTLLLVLFASLPLMACASEVPVEGAPIEGFPDPEVAVASNALLSVDEVLYYTFQGGTKIDANFVLLPSVPVGSVYFNGEVYKNPTTGQVALHNINHVELRLATNNPAITIDPNFNAPLGYALTGNPAAAQPFSEASISYTSSPCTSSDPVGSTSCFNATILIGGPTYPNGFPSYYAQHLFWFSKFITQGNYFANDRMCISFVNMWTADGAPTRMLNSTPPNPYCLAMPAS